MTTRDFNRLSSYISNEYGIKMPAAKKVLLECRLQKRLSQLNISSYAEYCDFLFSNYGMQHEVMHMVDAVTTNKTDFFREPGHFDFLNQYALPELYHEFGGQKQIDIWSAGCSSGEEVYTLAMILYEFAEMIAGTGFHIQGTDISSRMLSKAVDAVYTEERIADIPMWLKKKYFLKSKDRVKKTVRVHAALRAKVEFSYLNLMDDSYAIDKNYDIIFCRNVLIYFDKTTQYHVINKLAHKLRSGGFLFLGHSETITNMQLPLVQIQPTILRKL